MKNKKRGIELDVVAIVLAVIIFFILVVMNKNLFAKTGKEGIDFLSTTADEDKDDVANAFDKCICSKGTIENDGCPSSIRTEEDKRKHRERVEGYLKDNYDCEKINKFLGLK